MGWLWAAIGTVVGAMLGGIAAALWERLSERTVNAAFGRLPKLLPNRLRKRLQLDAKEHPGENQGVQRPPEHSVQKPRPIVGRGHEQGPFEPDDVTVAVMKLLAERSHLTPRRASTLLGCHVATAEHRLQLLQSRGLVRWDSISADGHDYHLTFEGREWLHHRGIIA